MPLTPDQLNALLNSWPEGTAGHVQDRNVIAMLDEIGKQIGYGALEQLAHALYLVQCHKTSKDAADMKRGRFGLLGWPLPADFEGVAKVQP